MGDFSTNPGLSPEHVAALRHGFAPIAHRALFVVRRGKVPHGSDGRRLTGSFADTATQAKFMLLEAALALAPRGKFDGIGIAFYPGCGVVGLDLDHCIGADGDWHLRDEQTAALRQFMGRAFIEKSMSGTGLHAFALGDAETVKANGEVELFGDKNFVAVTGDGAGTVDRMGPGGIAKATAVVRSAQKRCAAARALDGSRAEGSTQGNEKSSLSAPLPSSPSAELAPSRGTKDPSINGSILTAQSRQPSKGTEDLDRARGALFSGLPPRSHSEWVRLLFAIRDAVGERGHQMAREWSAQDPAMFNAAKFETAWKSAKPREDGITAATLFAWARGNGWVDGEPKPILPLTDLTVTRSVILTCANTIEPEPIEWLWASYMAKGKLHVLAGAPGGGKTTITMAFAAVVSRGGKWPDGSQCKRGRVVIWTGEDDPKDTLVPRLMAAGADLDYVSFVTGSRTEQGPQPFDPARDMGLLLAAFQELGDVALLIVDPIVSAVAADSHKGAEVRRALQPLVDLGAETGAAIVGITHFSKGTAGRDPTERVTGSYAFGAVARVVMIVARLQGQDGAPEKRLLARSKSNIGPDEGGFEYALEQVEASAGIYASRVVWGAAVEGTARELLAVAEAEPEKADGAAQGAEAFLHEALSRGAVAVLDLMKDATGAGATWSQVKRASLRLGVIKAKTGMRGGWMWSLPTTAEGDEGDEGRASERLDSSIPSVLASAPPAAAPANRGPLQ